MKSFITFLLLIILSSKLPAQCVSIELSVCWKNGDSVFFTSDGNTCHPYLNIIYRNNSDMPLYFLKVSQGRKGFPQIIRSSLIGQTVSNKSALNYANYSGNSYLIELGTSHNYLDGWEILPDTLTSGLEHEIDVINDDLADIYEYIFNKTSTVQTDISKEKRLHFKKSEINPDGILKSINDHFVFLDTGEIYSESYNLIGFELVRGNFTFIINQNGLRYYVYTEPIWDNNQAKYIETKAYLPEKVGKYKLFYGDFYSNETTIKFSNSQ
jgi:hypothetical protein